MHLWAQGKEMSLSMDAVTDIVKLGIVSYIKASPLHRKDHLVKAAHLDFNSIYLIPTVSPTLRVWL